MTAPDHTDAAPAAPEIEAVLRGQHENPFGILGMHERGGGLVVNAFVPDAAEVTVLDNKGKTVTSLERINPEGFFHASLKRRKKRFAYRLRCRNAAGHEWEIVDPYAFGPVLGERDE